MRRVTPFLVGLLFGLGLCLSGMTNPAKVLGFLDLAGAWDPSLAFVMGGRGRRGLFRLPRRLSRGRTLAGEPLDLPASTAIDGRLIGGSLLFGVGWGLVGLCPGPAIADIGFLDGRAALFVLAMAAGMAPSPLCRRSAPPRPRRPRRGWLSARNTRVAANCASAPFAPRRCAARRRPSAPARRRGGTWNTASSAGSVSARIWLSRASPSRAARQNFWTADRLSIGQIPAPSSKSRCALSPG